MEQSLHIGSFLDPLLTYVLVSLPSILTLRCILYIYSMYQYVSFLILEQSHVPKSSEHSYW